MPAQMRLQASPTTGTSDGIHRPERLQPTEGMLTTAFHPVHRLCSWRSLLISSPQSTWNPAAFCNVSSQTRTFKYILSTQRDLFLPDKHGECALVDPRKSSDLPLELLLLAFFLMHMRIIMVPTSKKLYYEYSPRTFITSMNEPTLKSLAKQFSNFNLL